MNKPTTPNHTDPIRHVRVFNDEAVPVNPFGLMRVKSLRDDGILVVGYPNASDQTTLVVNGPMPIVSKDYGQGSFSFPAVVAIDQAGKNPVPGESWGTVSGKWNLQRGQQGFQIMAVQSGDTVNRVLVDKRFGNNSGISEWCGYVLDADLTTSTTDFLVDVTGWRRISGAYPLHTNIEIPSSGTWYIEVCLACYSISTVYLGNARITVEVFVNVGTDVEHLAPLEASLSVLNPSICGMGCVAWATDASNYKADERSITLQGILRTTGPAPEVKVSILAVAGPFTNATTTITKSLKNSTLNVPCSHVTLIRLGD